MEMEDEIKELIEQIENTINLAVQKGDWDAIYTMRNVTQQMDEKIFDIITKIVVPFVVSEKLGEEF